MREAEGEQPCAKDAKNMLIRITALIAMALALATSSPAQEPPESPGDSERGFYHGKPDCGYTDRFCVCEKLFNGIGPRKKRPKPMKKGSINLRYQWDSNFSRPYETVCKLHRPHGLRACHRAREGSYLFALLANRSWRLKPRVAYSDLSWEPTHKIASARFVGRGKLLELDFTLLGSSASTCKSVSVLQIVLIEAERVTAAARRAGLARF